MYAEQIVMFLTVDVIYYQIINTSFVYVKALSKITK